MGRKRLLPIVEMMSMYEDLDERDRSIFADWIRKRSMGKPRKSTAAPSAERKSSRKSSGGASPATSETERETAGVAAIGA